LISIIMPAYNEEKFIRNAVTSILKQTCRDFELLVVDDGSTDATGKILQELCRQDRRIKGYTQKNAGVSAARNRALTNAKGDFVTMADADDALPPDALETLLSFMGKGVDLVIGSHEGVKGRAVPAFKKPARYEAHEIVQHFDAVDPCLYFPWAKLYRRSVIVQNHLQFDPGISFGEDHIFNLHYVGVMSGAAVVTDQIVYRYFYLRGGLCSKYYDNMNQLQKAVLLCVRNYLDTRKSGAEKCREHETGTYLTGCFNYYLAWLPLKKAEQKIRETLLLFSNLLSENLYSSFFTMHQREMLQKGQYHSFAVAYRRGHFRDTLIRKYRRKCRMLLENAIRRDFGK
jgi:glycosyltransferase involved in cell wall biosynthesis